MSPHKQRGGYLATPQGVQQLKEAKRLKKYTDEQLAQQAHIPLERVQDLFNSQLNESAVTLGEEAIESLCTLLDLEPEEIFEGWDLLPMMWEDHWGNEGAGEDESGIFGKISGYRENTVDLLELIEQAAREKWEELDLSNLELAALPSNIGKLTRLKKLIVGKWDEQKREWVGNSLTALPPEIGQLTRLTHLSLSLNQLATLPPEIGQLTQLTHLDLSINKLTALPPEIGQLVKLAHLDLRFNQLTALPPEIGQLVKLAHLDLRFNKLTELPSNIGQLAQLVHWDLRFNQLATLPPEIGKLASLVHLDLRFNQLATLPPEIGQLVSLVRLYLRSNKLATLPSGIGQLIHLTRLYLRTNKLTTLPPEVGKLVSLKRLYLRTNKLATLPPEIGKLVRLTHLDLGSNKLTSLPSEIGKLTNLSYLILNSNKLANLPPEIGKLTNLSHFKIEGNRLTNLPPEIRRSDSATILNYYQQLLQTQQRKPLNEAKMLLVGQGSVGKTSLVKRLLENSFNPRENKTDGIKIKLWPIAVDGKTIQLNVWDFGGQEIMHATHQFFLTKRSLYLLAIDARLGEEDNRIEYWLKMIQSFGDDSPIIIVGNKIDQHPLDLDRRGLQSKYPAIKAFVETSCETGDGIEELKEVITREITKIEHLSDLLPSSWFAIKKVLENLDRDYIPYNEYEALCEREKVSDEFSQQTLIGFLHDLGVVLNFSDDPRLEDTYVLNPEWVTNGVYKILNDHQLIVEHKGILHKEMLSRILDPHDYPRKKHSFIIDMMRKFELCFEIETGSEFLIPDLLSKEEPYTGEWDNSLAFEYHYPILPSSIISRFIVRMRHCLHDKNYWRSGVVLVYEENQALVKADREEKKISIRVAGPKRTRRILLTAIRVQFASIHKTIPGLTYEEKIALPKHPDIVLDYQELIALQEMGETSIPIGKLRTRIPLQELLDGIAPKLPPALQGMSLDGT
ncbi:MAG: COR domain-containing protein [Cyanobacteriota bacterium]|nr:COR domain-containing protein [Cyanobacteriota bacterium]